MDLENAIVNCVAYSEGIRVASVDIDNISEILEMKAERMNQ